MRNKHCQLTERYQSILWWQKVNIIRNHRCMFMRCFLEIKFADMTHFIRTCHIRYGIVDFIQRYSMVRLVMYNDNHTRRDWYDLLMTHVCQSCNPKLTMPYNRLWKILWFVCEAIYKYFNHAKFGIKVFINLPSNDYMALKILGHNIGVKNCWP